MTHEDCFKKELRPDLVNNHFEDNMAKFLTAVKIIAESEVKDYVKIEMIENRLLTYKDKMRYSTDLFC